ncbi:MAG: CarD family transcriptional regulator [Acutalibacteraceae bacterium]
MYKKNDTVIYIGSGICKIEDVRTECFSKVSAEYYVLRPVSEKTSRYYVPVGSETGKFTKLIDKQEIDSLFSNVKNCADVWVDDEKKRSEVYSELIKDTDRVKIIKMVGELIERKNEKNPNAKRLKAIDERFLKEGRGLIESELSYVLSMEPGLVGSFISKKLKA